MTYEVESVVDYPAIIAATEKNPEMIALSGREDVKMVLETLKELHDELHIHQFDSIQIYRGGVDLLRVILKKENQVGRSVYVEINDFRRRTQQLWRPETILGPVLTPIVLTFFTMMVATLCQRKMEATKRK